MIGAALFLSSCQSDIQNDIASTPEWSTDAIAFSGTVSASQVATRANGSIVNLGEHSLPETKERTNYLYNPTTGSVEERKETYYAGIFGCYTGQNTWTDLVKISQKVSPSETETKQLEDYYSANLFFNQKAEIGENGELTYTPLRFWPNNKLTSGLEAGQHEYCTFLAYYPYNETSSSGQYGISITNEAMGKGRGFGTVTFTMHADASQQNDFMISAPVIDANRDKYPIEGNVSTDGTKTFDPKPVPFRFYHMLAQVRMYAYVRGVDKMVYVQEDGHDKLADATWFDSWALYGTIKDAWGNVYTKKGDDAVERTTQWSAFPTEFAADLTKAEFLALGLKVPDETKCVRWERNDEIWDVNHTRRRSKVSYSLAFNNIKTKAAFYPQYNVDGKFIGLGHDEAGTLGSATVNHYIMNPYWFRFHPDTGERYMLNDHYMYGYFEDTPAYTASESYPDGTTTMSGDLTTLKEDGKDWSAFGGSNAMGYDISDDANHSDREFKNYREGSAGYGKHYNYPPGNILMVVPQVLNDDDVPHIVVTAKGKVTENGVEKDATAKLTLNMLKLGLKWESGFIYCYAIVDELAPGDDVVRGPESITVIFDTTQWTDQW